MKTKRKTANKTCHDVSWVEVAKSNLFGSVPVTRVREFTDKAKAERFLRTKRGQGFDAEMSKGRA